MSQAKIHISSLSQLFHLQPPGKLSISLPGAWVSIVCSVFFLLLPVASYGEYYWEDGFMNEHWESYQEACNDGEISARVQYLDTYYSQDAPHYSQGSSSLESPVKAYCGWSIHHYEYIPGYGYYLVTDTYGSIFHYLEGPELGGECNKRPSSTLGSTTDGIDVFTGNKYNKDTDFSIAGNMGLTLTRSYNSLALSAGTGSFGKGWLHTFEQKIEVSDDYQIRLQKKSGRHLHFALIDGEWESASDINASIIKEDDNEWLYTGSGEQQIHFNTDGLPDWQENPNGYRLEMEYEDNGEGEETQLKYVRDNLGQTLEFSYGENGFIAQIQHVESARIWQYQQDDEERLIQVAFPDGNSRQYHYTNTSFPTALTSISDHQDGTSSTYANYYYDENGRAQATEHADTINRRDIDIASNGVEFPEVTNSLGQVLSYVGDIDSGITRVTYQVQQDEADTSHFEYTGDNQLSKLTRNGHITTYGNYNTNNNPGIIVEAAETSQARQTSYVYDGRFFNKITGITEPSVYTGANKTTAMAYSDQGKLTNVSINGFTPDGTAVSSSTSYEYDGPLSQLSRINGPRSDVNDFTRFRYYPLSAETSKRGHLQEVEDASGTLIRANIQYNDTGRIVSEDRPDGLSLSYTYYPNNDRRQTFTATGNGMSRTSRFTYLATGEIETVTRLYGTPAARTETYSYDSGRRLTRITDHEGNSIRYILNTEGERTKVEYYDSSDALVKYSDFEYNAKGLVTKVIEQGSDTEEYIYDTMGNLESYNNGLNQQTVFDYDPLQQVKKKTRISAQDDLVTDYTHGVHNNITGVTDPRTATTYTNDDLGNRVTETSPDTGLTTYNYDPAGNLILHTDSNGNSISSSYDALNRLQSIHYPDASQDTSFTYDQGTNGTGRLTGVTDSSGSTSYQYNIFGQLLSEIRVINTLSRQTSYTYNQATGELETITYPSGLSLSLQRDSNGQVSGISADGVQLATNVNYLPFGPVTSLSLGSLTSTRSFDKRYNLTRIKTGPLDYLYARNSLGQITKISGIDIPTSVSALINYDYLSASNRLIDENGNPYTYDNKGNITSDGINTYTYDQSNRLVEVQQNGVSIASYSYNPANQRIVKTTGTSTVYYHYDTSGKLISETDGTGTPLRDYIYLNNEPLAVKIYTDTPGTYYFLNDHLGTPQKLVDSSGTVVWQAVYLHYGKALVTVDTISNNLRLPGQYFDEETGLHYNWHRFYDPATGRYISADPIGLQGGINLYAYVSNDPVNFIDPWGLDWKRAIDILTDTFDGGHSAMSNAFDDYARNYCENNYKRSLKQCEKDCDPNRKASCIIKAKDTYEKCKKNSRYMPPEKADWATKTPIYRPNKRMQR